MNKHYTKGSPPNQKSLLGVVRSGYELEKQGLKWDSQGKVKYALPKIWYRSSKAKEKVAGSVDNDNQVSKLPYDNNAEQDYYQFFSYFRQAIGYYVDHYHRQAESLEGTTQSIDDQKAIDEAEAVSDQPVDYLNNRESTFHNSLIRIIDKYFKKTQDERFETIRDQLGEQGVSLLVQAFANEVRQRLERFSVNNSKFLLWDNVISILSDAAWKASLASTYDIAQLYQDTKKQDFNLSNSQIIPVNAPSKNSAKNGDSIKSAVSALEQTEITSYWGQKASEISHGASMSSLSTCALALGRVGVGLSVLTTGYETSQIYADVKQGKAMPNSKVVDNISKYAESGLLIGGLFLSKLNPVASGVWLCRQSYLDYYDKYVHRPEVDKKVQSLSSALRYKSDLIEQKRQQLQEHLQGEADQVSFFKANQLKNDIQQTQKAYQQTFQEYKHAKHEQDRINKDRQSWLPRRERRRTTYTAAAFCGNILFCSVVFAPIGLGISLSAYTALILDQEAVFNKVKKACSNLVSKLKSNDQKIEQPEDKQTSQQDDHLVTTRQLIEQFHGGQQTSHDTKQYQQSRDELRKQLDQTLQDALNEQDGGRIMQFVADVSETVQTQTSSTNERAIQLKLFMQQFEHCETALTKLHEYMGFHTTSDSDKFSDIPKQTIMTLYKDQAIQQAMSQLIDVQQQELTDKLSKLSVAEKQRTQPVSKPRYKVTQAITQNSPCFDKADLDEQPSEDRQDQSPCDDPDTDNGLDIGSKPNN